MFGVLPYSANEIASRIEDLPAPIGPTMPTSRRSRQSKVVEERYERKPSSVSSRGRIGLLADLPEEGEQLGRRVLLVLAAVVLGVEVVPRAGALDEALGRARRGPGGAHLHQE